MPLITAFTREKLRTTTNSIMVLNIYFLRNLIIGSRDSSGDFSILRNFFIYVNELMVQPIWLDQNPWESEQWQAEVPAASQKWSLWGNLRWWWWGYRKLQDRQGRWV